MGNAITALLADDLYGFAPGQSVLVRIKGEAITAVAALAPADVEALLHAEPGIADLRGKLVLPGLIDAHLHAIASGMLLLGTDCRHAASLAELRALVAQAAATGSEFVRLGGLDLSRLGLEHAGQLTRTLLDSWLPDRALYIKSIEGHSSWFNTRAWERVGVDAALAQAGAPPEQQAQMRESGRVYGAAYELLTTPVYDSYSFEERRAGLETLLTQAASLGLTGLHCLEGYGAHRRADYELVLELNARGPLDLTLYCRDATPAIAQELGVPRCGGCWLVDGAIAAHSAALDEPYADCPESRGDLYHTTEHLRDWFEAGLKLGMQPCVHAIGGRALAQALDALAPLAARYDFAKLRPRVDHWVCGTPELARRAAKLGVIAAMQPVFDALWGGAAGGYSLRLGSVRALDANPVGQMIAAGLTVAAGSDHYIGPLDPLAGIRGAMYHHNPAQRVGFDAAVALYTSQAAYFSHEENSRGQIAPGFQADFTVVNGTRVLEPEARCTLALKRGQVIHGQL
jgi:predicted amidohydrolase YtcJ